MKKKQERIYMDYAATTPVDPRVFRVMEPYFSQKFGNPASVHHFGREANLALERSRQVVAKILNAQPSEIVFTSSATESNNFALKGVAFANKSKGKHIIISSIEHDCVLESARWLKEQGFIIEQLPVDKNGLVRPKEVEKAIRKDTILVSVMHANNEIGTIQPIESIGKICRRRGILFHTDAVQSFGKIPIDVLKMNVDLLTASSHKMYGPKGAALLYIRSGVQVEPLLHGGGQENNRRSSTVNVAAIVGFAKAVEICQEEMTTEGKRQSQLRDYLIEKILNTIPHSFLNGHPQKRLPNNINVRFSFIEGEALVARLDALGVAASSASACSSPRLEPSHVLLACGLRPEEAHGSLRLTLGRGTTKEEVDYLLKVLPQVVADLRRLSPYGNKD